MKRVFLSSLFFIFSFLSYGSHIVGGEMIYEYIGPGSSANTFTYRITLKLFRDQNCNNCAAMPVQVSIGIFNNDDGNEFPVKDQPHSVNKSREDAVPVNTIPSCVTNIPRLNYDVGYYVLTIDLPKNDNGYSAAYQTCCRVNPLRNVFNTTGTGGTGSTYYCEIPPFADNSPNFKTSIDLLCSKRQFTLDFSATDADNDSLVYAFSEAYNGGRAVDANNINPDAPPYASVRYINGFSLSTPLGEEASINSKTGIISGIAPMAGEYVVGVVVSSYRNGALINEHTKDFIINIGNCDLPGATLGPKPVTCDGFEVNFSNENNSTLNKTYFWDFGDPNSGPDNTSTLVTPVHKFSDTGVFVYKLIVNKGEACADSSTQTIKVYPGFFPGFISAGQCKNTPIRFRDTTKSVYGTVNKWSWNFGNSLVNNDTSNLQNPSYVYSDTASYTVRLIVSSDKGCIDTAYKNILVKNKPDFTLTHDTLICVIDTLELNAIGRGTVFWTPNYNINNQNSQSPLVSPDVPTTYYALLTDEFGCKGTDSVFVDVRRFVTLNAGNDTTICLGDEIQFTTTSDALSYIWTPGTFLNADNVKAPKVTPLSNTTYKVTGTIGKCKASDAINIKVVPYPLAKAGNDSSICLGTTARLHASGGSIYSWSPAFFLNNPNIADPVANPEKDIRYVVTVRDVLGCPKPVSDTVTIKVQNLIADAGPRDTAIVLDQPLLLKGTGGEVFHWTPSTGLSNPESSNPVSVISENQQYILQVSSSIGCVDTDTINVIVYKVAPGLYVPNAFTPDNNGKNDVFRPIPLGMKSLTYFKVYNRWGQLMFSTNEQLQGWDGKVNGKPQDAAVYAWIAEGVDYQNKVITKKGTVVLIR